MDSSPPSSFVHGILQARILEWVAVSSSRISSQPRDRTHTSYISCREQKNWCLWIVVLEKTLESPLDCKEIQPVHPIGDQSGIFIGKTDAEAEAPVLWAPNVKNWLTGKDPDAGKCWRREEKGMTEDEIVEWHHWLDGHEFEHTWELVMDREAWHAIIHGVERSWMWLNDCTTRQRNYPATISLL